MGFFEIYLQVVLYEESPTIASVTYIPIITVERFPESTENEKHRYVKKH